MNEEKLKELEILLIKIRYKYTKEEPIAPEKIESILKHLYLIEPK